MKKILIIDDSAFMRGILKNLLMDGESTFKEKLDICEMDGKSNALKQFMTETPDVILVDVVMQESETEGIEFLEAIQKSFDMNRVIVVSSVGQDAMINRCKKLGVIYYLQKPFDEREIVKAVANVLALREQVER